MRHLTAESPTLIWQIITDRLMEVQRQASEKYSKRTFAPYRDELIISTKAGYDMWPGPYGNFGSRKHLLAGIDGSLKRMGLDYVDIFYHHRPDPETPMEETADAMEQIVRQGKAIYIGLSNYKAKETEKMTALLKERHVPFVIHQPSYSMLNRWIEEDGLDKGSGKRRNWKCGIQTFGAGTSYRQIS